MRHRLLVAVAVLLGVLVGGAVGWRILIPVDRSALVGGLMAQVDTVSSYHVRETMCPVGGPCSRSESWWDGSGARYVVDAPEGHGETVLIPPYRWDLGSDGVWRKSSQSGDASLRPYLQNVVRIAESASGIQTWLLFPQGGTYRLELSRSDGWPTAGGAPHAVFVVDAATFAPVRLAWSDATRTETLDFDSWNAPVAVAPPAP